MSDPKIEGYVFKPGFKGMADDTGSDQTMFKGVHWGKAMMWIFLLSDTFIFGCFLISYRKGRESTIIDFVDDGLKIIREGTISKKEIEKLL